MSALPLTDNVLTNDSDPNGLPLTVISNTLPSNGTLTDGVNPDGSFTYQASPGFMGIDTFSYTAANSAGLESTASVVIQVPCCEPNTNLGNPIAQYNACAVDAVIGEIETATDITGNGRDINFTSTGSPVVNPNALDTFPLVTYAPNEQANDVVLPDSNEWTFVLVADDTNLGTARWASEGNTNQVETQNNGMRLRYGTTFYTSAAYLNPGNAPSTYVWRINGTTGRITMYQNGVNLFDTTIPLIGFPVETFTELLATGTNPGNIKWSDFAVYDSALPNGTLDAILADYQARYPSLPNQTLIV